MGAGYEKAYEGFARDFTGLASIRHSGIEIINNIIAMTSLKGLLGLDNKRPDAGMVVWGCSFSVTFHLHFQ